MSRSVMEVKHICKTYGDQVVLDDLSFSLDQGERIALFAPSGAGKTTLVKILTHLEKPDQGDVTFSIVPSAIYQEPRLFPFLTVIENILLPYKALNLPVLQDTIQKLEGWLSVCELTAFRTHYPYQLSGGMKQKVSIVRGMLPQPKFVLMDEPFQSIGETSKEKIIQHVLTTNPDLSLLLITHNINEVNQLATQAMIFNQDHLSATNFERISISQESNHLSQFNYGLAQSSHKKENV